MVQTATEPKVDSGYASSFTTPLFLSGGYKEDGTTAASTSLPASSATSNAVGPASLPTGGGNSAVTALPMDNELFDLNAYRKQPDKMENGANKVSSSN